MHKLLHSIIITLCVILLAPTSVIAQSNQNAAADTTNSFAQINLLFIQTASHAVLKEMPNRPGYYQLILEDINPYVTYFSQRPKRLGGIVPVENFVKAWNIGPNNFADNNPNGVLVPCTIDGALNTGEEVNLVTLSHPNYYPTKNILVYLVKPILTQRFVFKEIKYEHVTLLIG